MSPCSAGTHAPCLFGPAADGAFEIDGNRTVDSSNGIDWSTASSVMSVTHFSDTFSSITDDSFKAGSHRDDQSTWTCEPHHNTPKDDIIDGNIAIRTVNSHQYLYFDFSRVKGGGDTFIEFNFSKATHSLTTNKGCNALPVRETGDLSVEFAFTSDSDKAIAVEKWNCPTTPCPFSTVDLPRNEGTVWEQAYNEDVTYGEAALDLSALAENGLGAISCNQFSKVWMDSHAAETDNNKAEMKDLVAPITFNACGSPTVVTAASPAVTLGGNISDTATLAGAINPGGSITFVAYGPNPTSCSGTPAFTSTVAVNGNGSYGSGPFPTTAAGTYKFQASYSGDANNSAASDVCTDAGESVTVNPVAPVVVPPGGTGGTAGTGTQTVTGSNPGAGVEAAGGVAPAAVGLPRTRARPQGSAPPSPAARAHFPALASICPPGR